MQPNEYQAIKPAEYLKGGFFDAKGAPRDRINGYYSLGMAYRIKGEGKGPDAVKALLERLAKFGETHLRGGPGAASRPLTETDQEEFEQAWGAEASPALAELKQTVVPLLTDWKQYGAAVLHVERIMKQLAFICAATAGKN